VIDREAVRSNAKYLREVRPIDPEEIHEYIEGTPHPAVVRRTLREEAFDLGLVERSDGTFVPVDDDPAPHRQWRPTALPERYATALEDCLAERYGVEWHTGPSGDRLRTAVGRLKEDYYRGRDVTYDETAALGYALYHLPDYFAAVGYVLDDLTETRSLPRTLRVLDVGAGVGGPALGLFEYLPDDALVDYHAVEPSAAADVLEPLLEESGRNVHTTVHRTTAEAFDPDATLDGPVDLAVFGNVLSELDEPAAVAERYFGSVADDGTLLALAPADRNTSVGLRAVERHLAREGATVYAPTLRLWPGEHPANREWSFDVGTDLDVPAFQRRLDEAGDGDGTFVNTTVQFSYALLRHDGTRRVDVRADDARHAKFSQSERHVTERVNCLAVKLSHDLSEGGNPLYLVGDGSQQVDHYAVLTKPSTLNDALGSAPYGTVLAFENLLVLWNDDEGAYNLVVDGETVVDRVA
jgi:SAM-dependent methyltransferase